MASRRVPLASMPHAANSPFRNGTTTSGKRTRAQGDSGLGQPPSKKQILGLKDENDENVDPKRRAGVAMSTVDKPEEPFSRRSNAHPTALEKKLAAVRDKRSTSQQQPKDRVHKGNAENLESIRQWQRHYRKQFPNFVIYFDNVPDDVRSKTIRQIQSLGAREEKFFSNKVTHVVTTRSIPPELATTSPEDQGKDDSTQQKVSQQNAASDVRKGTFLLDAHMQRRANTHAAHAPVDVDPKKLQNQGADILSRARQLGIKIWALEKLHRMLSTILDTDAGDQGTGHDTRSHVTGGRTASKAGRNADLEQLLRNEKLTGPTDRDMSVAGQDMATFRGCYLYVHDMDEKTKPVMVRDYPKPGARETGKWPQFRLSGPGRCPFVEDPSYQKRQAQEASAAKAQEELTTQRRLRATSAQETAASRQTQDRPLTERHANLRRSPRKIDAPAKPLDPPKPPPANKQILTENVPLFGSTQQSLRGLPRMIGGEPVASGVQASNVTSAIRSQYVSSAAISSTAPGANHRVGDSKEVSALKRKVLERGNSINSTNSVLSSHMNDMRAALNGDNEPPPRAAKRKAQETLGVVNEDEEDYDRGKRPSKQRKPAPRRRKPVERDPKPGYCENCRDKFDDFDEHIQSRKHRKFAMTQDNWKELDELLGKLKRPHKVFEVV
ncbi:hypothetical protein BTJ68_06133 [Hortaea werneckii EXF-2000]|uniref:DBF4-type domain-containing protein n=2 Tax=Hortaea werneckii TaxID=91943 RepID=A0A1Z5TBC5_HORWE|nr:hypothetical protein BTJ68_06133 [Hortaea werneckii EXF-2000]